MEGNAERMERVIEAFADLETAIKEAFRPIVKTFQELYSGLAEVTASPELKRLIKKARRQQSIRDRRQRLERSRQRQQLLAENTDKSNNWLRLHGLPARRKLKKSYKKH